MTMQTFLKRNHKSSVALLGLVMLIMLAGTAFAAGKKPSFSLPSAVDGSTISLNSYKGDVVVVNFFATWCPPCRMEIPSLVELREELKDKGFEIIGISVDEAGPKIVKRLIDKMHITYPVVMSDDTVTRRFGGIMGIPVSFLLDKEGNIVHRYDGYVDHDVLKKAVNDLLGDQE